MRRAFAVALLVACAIVAIASMPVTAHEYYCGWSPLQTQIVVYEHVSFSNLRGEDCNSDSDWTNGIDGTTSNISDKMSSFALTGRSGETWCVYLYEHTGSDGYGDYLVYRVHNGQDRHVSSMPSGWNDRVSAHSQLKIAYNGTCPS